MVDTNMIEFGGFCEETVTFASDLDSAAEGKALKVSLSKKVVLAADDDMLHGKAIKIEKDGAVTVQLKGYTEFEYSGIDPSAGYCKLLADANGGVKVDTTNGREYLVLSIDTTNKIVGFML